MNIPLGNREEWERFNKTFTHFILYYPSLMGTIKKVFDRRGEGGNKVDRVIFGLGRVCSEDFEQVVTLCINGFGIGGLQIMRGMYERQVTAAYLSKYPDEVDAFAEYWVVQRRKGANHLRTMYGPERVKQIIPDVEREELERSFQKVKTKFTETICEPCGKTRLMMSWTKHSLVSLAQKADPELAESYYNYYYRPTLFSHSTVSSLLQRLVPHADGSWVFDLQEQRIVVGEALIAAHALMVSVLKLQNRHFKLGLGNKISLHHLQWAHSQIQINRVLNNSSAKVVSEPV